MKRTLFILTLILLFYKQSFTQNFTEYYFSFDIKEKSELETLTKIISIDNVINNSVYAYSTDKDFEKFKSLNYKYTLLSNPSKSAKVDMATSIAEMANWDKYPSHEVYIEMMHQFGENYPDICKIDTIGFSEDGREVLVAKISDNVNEQENEPEVFYTGQMHGDEIVCYIMFLRLIDNLLDNYSTDSQAQNIINNTELWINPLSNPDGTYAGGNNTVNSATRSNSNGIDLNRNYPDPDNGPHPDGKSYQAETQMMMDFADAHNFILSINSHSGAEVMNYPWDTWSRRHVDDNWYQYASLIYADLAIANSPSGYFTSTSSNGIINGYDWYVISGGRQDYMNYYKNCREITLELSKVKMLSATLLPDHWNYNKDAMLAFIEESLNGIKGMVKDSDENPLNAMVKIENHDTDIDSSMVFTDSEIGDYHRLIEPGTYNVIASAYGFISDTVKNVNVISENCQITNFILTDGVKYSLSGTIKDAIDDSPLENVKLELTNTPLSAELTNEDGLYYFQGVVEDTINVLIQKEGFIPIDTNILFFSTDTIYNFKLYPAKTEDFEEADFNKFNWKFTGNANWIISSNSYEGDYSAESGNIGDNQSSSMELTETISQDGYISFYKKVSSEASYDFLKFYINGVVKGQWSGESDWSIAQYEITEGVHTFKWQYVKDGNTSRGSDCAWIDLISLPANDTNLYLTPKYIYDTLNINEVSEHQFFIINNGNVSNEYSINADQSWINVDVTNDILDYNETDTITLSINSTSLSTGYYSSNIIVSSQNLKTDTIYVNLMIRDTISSSILPDQIIDTLWAGNSLTYDIVITNNGVVSLDYSVEIENSTENSWISLNQNSGSLLLTESDTIKVAINTTDIGFGEFNCNIIFHEQDEDSDTIPIFIYIKDTIISEINPNSITDTLNQNSTKNYPIIIKNIGNRILDYTLTIAYPTKSGTWISLDKDNGSINLGNIDTVIATINTNNLLAGDYVCSISIYESDGDEFGIPVDLHVNQVQSVEIPYITYFRLFPNPFNNYIEIEFYTIDNKNVNISLYDICGKKLYEDNFETVSNSINKFKILESDFKSGELQKGIYFIQLLFDKEKLTKRVLKN